jgi:DNA-binding PadR family transcriptional regulator
LTEIQREDYRAVVLDGQTERDRAEERGVSASAVWQNIQRAKDELADDDDQSSDRAPDHGRPDTYHTLTGFQRDVLEAIAAVEGEPYGLALKDYLDQWYPEPIHHSRLYQNLDQLVERGLVERDAIDDRTNAYRLTADGRGLLARQVEALAHVAERRELIADGGTDITDEDLRGVRDAVDTTRANLTHLAETVPDLEPGDGWSPKAVEGLNRRLDDFEKTIRRQRDELAGALLRLDELLEGDDGARTDGGTIETEHVPVVFLTYEDDADLEYDDEGQIVNHDELVDSGQTYREVRVLERHTVAEFDMTIVDENHPLWCEEIATLEPGDALRVDELREGDDD